MSDMRPTSDHERRVLKSVTQQLVRECGGVEAAAMGTRVSYQTLAAYGSWRNPKHEDVFIPLDVLMDLTKVGGPVAIREICRLACGMFLETPAANASDLWGREIAAVAKETGEAMSRLVEAYGNGGVITREEIEEGDLIREVSEAMESLAVVLHHLKRTVGHAPNASGEAGEGA